MLEIGGIIILGIAAQWVSWKTRVPAILPLILIGLLVGPISTLWTEDGSKWIEPIFDTSTGRGLFPGNYLFYFVSLAIGIILFEGGLTLKRDEIKGVGPAILKLIIIGSIVTFIGAGLASYYLMGVSWQIAFLFSALIIVTGPTVIAPILRNIPLTRNVATVLKWEGILIDPLGALAAVLVFEFIASGGHENFTSHALLAFLKIVGIGVLDGTLLALLLHQLIKRKLIPHYLLNVFTLALVLFAFVGSDMIAHESGLLTVVVMGMVLGNLNVAGLKEILYFKESLSVLLISILFILLSANINLEDLYRLNWNSIILFGVVILILRPLGVFLSTIRSGLNVSEKLFISWVGPRGIVAAGIASLFGLRLTQQGVEGAELITPLVFMIVLGTVLLNATTARLMARILGVTLDKSEGVLVVGASPVARLVAKYLQDSGRHVVVVDRAEESIAKAKEMGLESIETDVFSNDLKDNFELLDMGYMIAMTSSDTINIRVCERYMKDFGEQGAFRLISPDELKEGGSSDGAIEMFSYLDDYLRLSEIVRTYPSVHELEVEGGKEALSSILQKLANNGLIAPIFIKMKNGFIDVIPQNWESIDAEKVAAIVYMGKEIEDVEKSV